MDTSTLHLRPFFLRSIASSMLCTGLIGILFFIIGQTNFLLLKILFSSIAWTIFSFTGVCAASLHDRHYPQHWYRELAITGMIASIVGFIVMFIAVWDIFASIGVWQAAAVCIVISITLSIMCLFMPLRRPAKHHSLGLRILISATLISTAACGLLLIGYLIQLPIFYEDIYVRMIGATMIPAILGTISIPVLIHIEFLRRNTGQK